MELIIHNIIYNIYIISHLRDKIVSLLLKQIDYYSNYASKYMLRDLFSNA